ncbi:hypothetical protein C8J57DRAFT_1601530 [Mycena rebaudengoi]|nr:hypothetical protein C8J57DRAFT_1601530 [Mycena rebaudengoi]
MVPVELTPELQVSDSTHILFSSERTSVFWDDHSVRLVHLDDAGITKIETLKEISLDGQKIQAVEIHAQLLLVLTSTKSDTRWARPFRRRVRIEDDPWTAMNVVCSYDVHLIDLAQKSQIGPTLMVPVVGVYAEIRARMDKVLVKVIGPQDMAFIWQLSSPQMLSWTLLHEELTWDPDLIAGKMGFRNGAGELLRLEEIEATGEPLGDRRDEHGDEEILDYAFLSDTLVLRLHEDIIDGTQVSYRIDVFELRSPTATTSDIGAPLLRRFLHFSHCADGSTVASITADMAENELDSCIFITILNGDAVFQAILGVPELLSAVYTPQVPRPRDMHKLVYFAHDWVTAFTGYIYTGNSKGPQMYGKRLLYPVPDMDPTSAAPEAPALRFQRLSTPGGQVDTKDVPLSSLFDEWKLIEDRLRDSAAYSRYTVSWDGHRTLCVIFRDYTYLETTAKAIPRGWYLTLEDDVFPID